MIIVTHDPLIAQQADRIIEIKDGQIISDNNNHHSAPVKKVPPAIQTASLIFSKSLDVLREALNMAWRAMVVNKIRTLLTMLGIIIVALPLLSPLLLLVMLPKDRVLADIKAIGANTIDIYPGKELGSDSPEDKQS